MFVGRSTDTAAFSYPNKVWHFDCHKWQCLLSDTHIPSVRTPTRVIRSGTSHKRESRTDDLAEATPPPQTNIVTMVPSRIFAYGLDRHRRTGGTGIRVFC